MNDICIPSDSSDTRPRITIQAGHSRRFRAGHPWVFSNEIAMEPETKALAPGSLVTVIDAGGERLGVGTFNPHSLIGLRLISRDPDAVVDAGLIAARFRKAAALRDALIGCPYYRLIHAEADGLPGLIVDRYGDLLAIQVNTAGMERLLPLILEAAQEVFAPRAIVLKNDSPVRKLEGLELYDRLAFGELTGPVELQENGARFLATTAPPSPSWPRAAASSTSTPMPAASPCRRLWLGRPGWWPLIGPRAPWPWPAPLPN